jgi:hypothetical protein
MDHKTETLGLLRRLWVMNLLTNLRYTFRQITKNPGFFALAVAALAAGLAVLLRTLLFGVTLMAPGIYAATAAALVLVAVVACATNKVKKQIRAHRLSELTGWR